MVEGPNGAGKTTFAHEYIDTRPLPYISAGVIAESMAPRSIDEVDIRRRFSRSISNFRHDYRHMAHRWHLFYNGGARFHEAALGEGDSLEVRDEGLFDLFLDLAEDKSP